MTNQTPNRKSGRGRVPNKKYGDDDLELLNRVLSSDSEEDGYLQDLQAAEPRGDREFDIQDVVSNTSDTDSATGIESDSSAIATPVEDYEDAQSYVDESDEEVEARKFDFSVYRSGPKYWKKQQRKDTRSRGMPDNPILGFHRHSRLGPLAGPAVEDQMPIIQSMRLWGDDATLPKRSRMRYHFVHTEDKRNLEAIIGWNWYYEGSARDTLSKRQKVRHVSPDEGVRYLPPQAYEGHGVLLGPYGQQKLFHLSISQSVNIDDAWNQAIASHSKDGSIAPREARKHGWLLNAGARVRCLDWVPNQTGETQYLALATKNEKTTGSEKEAPAFRPAPPSPTGIQIWTFSTLPATPPWESSLGSDRVPELKQILCSDWGDAKQLTWCPMPRKFRDKEHDDNRRPLGLLGVVFDDGFVRVLDLTLDSQQHASPFSQLESAAVTIAPLTNSICTCLAWLSQSDIAIGHSNGFLAIYSIIPDSQSPSSSPTSLPTDPSSAPPTQSPPPTSSRYQTPWLLHRLHQTYITALTSAYPFAPHLLLSTSLSGHMRLTSLHAPTMSTMTTRRTSTPPHTLSYHPALHGAIFPDDGRELVNFSGLRFWGNNIGVGEATGMGGVMATDVGRVHSSVAWGTCDGRVVVSNPVRKVIKGTEGVWQLCVCKHEWVRRPPHPISTGQNITTPETVNGGEGGVQEDGEAVGPGKGRGISRVTEGYKVYKADVDNNAAAKSIIASGGRGKRGTITTTIYEEDTGVTAVRWNPNLHCGGWLAVGWGSGLVRVEDVGI